MQPDIAARCRYCKADQVSVAEPNPEGLHACAEGHVWREPSAAPVDYDGPNKWLNGVKARVEDTGDGYVRLPRSDWEGVVHGFEWGEVLFGDATDALRRILHFPYDVGHTPERDLREMREIASAGLVAVGLKEPEEDETDG